MLPIKLFLFLVLFIIHNTCGLTSKQSVSFTDLNTKDPPTDATTNNQNPADLFHINLSVPVLKTLAQKKP
ncbi:uncharacterized protein LOC122618934 [Drosophila teissieri]|uniref:uncharacterized protein LOC122618934 n=1 Tax=Drosophila teissieri TaxID=7243 RepID=UPI001CBA4DDF|nr:uncharacterized protein LOC122618934 [Drosophila teissieri]